MDNCFANEETGRLGTSSVGGEDVLTQEDQLTVTGLGTSLASRITRG